MQAQRKRKRAREYLRVSADKSGRLESPEQQHEVNTQHAESNDWVLGDPYAEQAAVSASRYTTKARAAFDRLCADLESGAFAADILIIWESSRGSRRVGEWVTLIELCEASQVLIYVTTHGRAYDPANPRDRRSLIEDATDSEYESAKISQRTRRSAAARAAEGRAAGRAPYGYRRVYDPVTRRLTAQEPHPDEAPVIRELFARLRAGESLRAIARDFAARGIAGRSGRPFSAQHLRDMALRATYAGLRVHQPVADGPRRPASLDGAVDGTWPALVDRETFYAVHAMLTGPARRTSRPGRGVHELSMIARCGPCGAPVAATYKRGPREYTCHAKSCVRIGADDLDAYAAAVITAYLDDPRNAARLAPDSGPELSGVRADLAAARADLADWRARAARREVTAASFAAIEPGIIAAVTELEERERQLSAPPELAGFLGDSPGYGEAWDAAGTAARRRVARLLCSPAYLGTLKVMRCPSPGHPVPPADRVTWDREDG